jgi:hypothetical protein
MVGSRHVLIGTLVFARTDYQGPPLTSLVDVINYVKPTALLGLSTVRVRLQFPTRSGHF